MPCTTAAYSLCHEVLDVSLPFLRQSRHEAGIVQGADLCYTQGALR